MKVYISGPIAGAPHVPHEEKIARFNRAMLALKQMGHEGRNPLDVHACAGMDCNPDIPAGSFGQELTYRHNWDCFLRHDLIAMLQDCDAIALLPDWEDSKGARLEVHVAHQLSWPVLDLTKNAVVLGLPYALQRGL